MNKEVERALNGELTTDYNTLRAKAQAVDPRKGTMLLPSELYALDAERKKFLLDVSALFRKGGKVEEVSDGYHTFKELYHHRALLFASICNQHPDLAWKSKEHDDPDQPMYDGMFICGILTPEGEATYHYDLDPYWDMFQVPEISRAPKFDGHTPAIAIERIFKMFLPKDE